MPLWPSDAGCKHRIAPDFNCLPVLSMHHGKCTQRLAAAHASQQLGVRHHQCAFVRHKKLEAVDAVLLHLAVDAVGARCVKSQRQALEKENMAHAQTSVPMSAATRSDQLVTATWKPEGASKQSVRRGASGQEQMTQGAGARTIIHARALRLLLPRGKARHQVVCDGQHEVDVPATASHRRCHQSSLSRMTQASAQVVANSHRRAARQRGSVAAEEIVDRHGSHEGHIQVRVRVDAAYRMQHAA